MFPISRSDEDKVDPVVASLTPSEKRQITELYGGGEPQPGSKWEAVPILTTKQIQLVMAEQNSSGMGPFASNVPTGADHHSQSSSDPPVAHSSHCRTISRDLRILQCRTLKDAWRTRVGICPVTYFL